MPSIGVRNTDNTQAASKALAHQKFDRRRKKEAGAVGAIVGLGSAYGTSIGLQAATTVAVVAAAKISGLVGLVVFLIASAIRYAKDGSKEALRELESSERELERYVTKAKNLRTVEVARKKIEKSAEVFECIGWRQRWHHILFSLYEKQIQFSSCLEKEHSNRDVPRKVSDVRASLEKYRASWFWQKQTNAKLLVRAVDDARREIRRLPGGLRDLVELARWLQEKQLQGVDDEVEMSVLSLARLCYESAMSEACEDSSDSDSEPHFTFEISGD